MRAPIRYALITAALILIQATFLRYVSIETITPDVLVIWIVYLALRYGQIHATVAGFVLGFTMDILIGNFLGLSSLSKTVSGFVAGYFYNEERTDQTLATYRFAVIVLIVSLIHNGIYFSIFVQGSELPFFRTTLLFGVATSLYTATMSFLPIFGFSRVKGDRVLPR